MAKKIDLKELLEKKEQIKNKDKKTAEIYIKSLDGTITIEQPSAALVKDAQGTDTADELIVYHCVVEPNLQDKKLQEEFGAKLPLDIVNIIFDPGEIPLISMECLKLSGYVDGARVVNTVKN